MIETLTLCLSGAAGGALGLVFFGGLWWSVRRGIASNQPALWFFVSLIVRMSIALTGFYFVSASRLDRMAACLCGFILARLAVIHVTHAGEFHQASEPTHAP